MNDNKIGFIGRLIGVASSTFLCMFSCFWAMIDETFKNHPVLIHFIRVVYCMIYPIIYVVLISASIGYFVKMAKKDGTPFWTYMSKEYINSPLAKKYDEKMFNDPLSTGYEVYDELKGTK